MAVVDSAAATERPAFIIQGVRPAEDSLLAAIHALHIQHLQGLPFTASTTPDIDWSALLEPSDDSDSPATITVKAVGLPDYGDTACNLVLIG